MAIALGGAMLALLLLAACTEDPGETGLVDDFYEATLEEVAAEAADGTPVLDGAMVRTRGIATVASGVLGGRKLRIHVQDGEWGVAVDADEVVAAEIAAALGGGIAEGDLLELAGLVTQHSLPSQDEEGALDGLTRVRVTDSAQVSCLDQGQPLPEPIALTLDDIEAHGDDWEGALVRVDGLVKAAEDADSWVTVLDNSTTIDTYEAGGAGPLKVRLGKGENTGGYGADPGVAAFGVVGLLREDTTVAPASDPEGMHFEIWPRREEDILR